MYQISIFLLAFAANFSVLFLVLLLLKYYLSCSLPFFPLPSDLIQLCQR